MGSDAAQRAQPQRDAGPARDPSPRGGGRKGSRAAIFARLSGPDSAKLPSTRRDRPPARGLLVQQLSHALVQSRGLKDPLPSTVRTMRIIRPKPPSLLGIKSKFTARGEHG
jgi:hypothetical protein